MANDLRVRARLARCHLGYPRTATWENALPLITEIKQTLHNDERPRTTPAEAERAGRHLLPEVIQHHEARRRTRRPPGVRT
jgi:hypothetical protein